MESTGLDLATAYAHAVQKWEYIRDNGGAYLGITIDMPHLRSYRNCCSYCQMFLNLSAIDVGEDPCVGCPLNILPFNGDVGCSRKGHPYLDWFMNSSTKTAQAVLDLIIKTKPI